MSSAVEDLKAKLVADSTVNGLVSGRVYGNVMVEAAQLPNIVLTVVSDTPENSLDGAADTRLRETRVQVDCYAKHYIPAQQLADAVDAVLGNLSANGLSAWRLARRDLFDNETQYYRVSMDFGVWR